MYKTRKDCRICNGGLEEILNLGDIYPSNFVDGPNPEIESVPLILVRCVDCRLVQLRDTINLDSMYRQYWYRSGLNSSMVKSLKDIVENIERRVALQPGEVVIDIGANDGTMLSLYSDPSLYKVGIDPAFNLAGEASDNCSLFINDYFSVGVLPPELPKARVITAIAMFYDLEDPGAFLDDVKRLLAPNGLFVVQCMDLVSMLWANAVDDLCHEHLEYYSLEILTKLFKQHGLKIYDASYNDTNGGSIRVYATHLGRADTTVALNELLDKERQYLNKNAFVNFKHQVETVKKIIHDFVHNTKKRVAVVGASTKGNTLLQYFGLDHFVIEHAADVNPDKFGKKTIGTLIPIISEQESLARNPDYYLVLIWAFKNQLLEKYKDYMRGGGKMIFPLPDPVVYYMEGEELKWMSLENLLEN